jgi:predicted nuclease with TOPRIM domain
MLPGFQEVMKSLRNAEMVDVLHPLWELDPEIGGLATDANLKMIIKVLKKVIVQSSEENLLQVKMLNEIKEQQVKEVKEVKEEVKELKEYLGKAIVHEEEQLWQQDKELKEEIKALKKELKQVKELKEHLGQQVKELKEHLGQQVKELKELQEEKNAVQLVAANSAKLLAVQDECNARKRQKAADAEIERLTRNV